MPDSWNSPAIHVPLAATFARPPLIFVHHSESVHPTHNMFTSVNKYLNRNKSKSNSDPREESSTNSGDSSESEQAKKRLLAIMAFRTIITMLSIIPSERVMTVIDRRSGRGAEDKELKLLNALATLLVRRNEVAAVAVIEHDNGSGVIQAVACYHHVSIDSPSGDLTIPQPAKRFGIFGSFLAAINPRKDTPIPNRVSDHPSIIDPKHDSDIPSDLHDTEDMERIRTYCYDRW